MSSTKSTDKPIKKAAQPSSKGGPKSRDSKKRAAKAGLPAPKKQSPSGGKPSAATPAKPAGAPTPAPKPESGRSGAAPKPAHSQPRIDCPFRFYGMPCGGTSVPAALPGMTERMQLRLAKLASLVSSGQVLKPCKECSAVARAAPTAGAVGSMPTCTTTSTPGPQAGQAPSEKTRVDTGDADELSSTTTPGTPASQAELAEPVPEARRTDPAAFDLDDCDPWFSLQYAVGPSALKRAVGACAIKNTDGTRAHHKHPYTYEMRDYYGCVMILKAMQMVERPTMIAFIGSSFAHVRRLVRRLSKAGFDAGALPRIHCVAPIALACDQTTRRSVRDSLGSITECRHFFHECNCIRGQETLVTLSLFSMWYWWREAYNCLTSCGSHVHLGLVHPHDTSRGKSKVGDYEWDVVGFTGSKEFGSDRWHRLAPPAQPVVRCRASGDLSDYFHELFDFTYGDVESFDGPPGSVLRLAPVCGHDEYHVVSVTTLESSPHSTRPMGHSVSDATLHKVALTDRALAGEVNLVARALWRGHVICEAGGKPVIISPAVVDRVASSISTRKFLDTAQALTQAETSTNDTLRTSGASGDYSTYEVKMMSRLALSRCASAVVAAHEVTGSDSNIERARAIAAGSKSWMVPQSLLLIVAVLVGVIGMAAFRRLWSPTAVRPQSFTTYAIMLLAMWYGSRALANHPIPYWAGRTARSYGARAVNWCLSWIPGPKVRARAGKRVTELVSSMLRSALPSTNAWVENDVCYRGRIAGAPARVTDEECNFKGSYCRISGDPKYPQGKCVPMVGAIPVGIVSRRYPNAVARQCLHNLVLALELRALKAKPEHPERDRLVFAVRHLIRDTPKYLLLILNSVPYDVIINDFIDSMPAAKRSELVEAGEEISRKGFTDWMYRAGIFVKREKSTGKFGFDPRLIANVGPYTNWEEGPMLRLIDHVHKCVFSLKGGDVYGVFVPPYGSRDDAVPGYTPVRYGGMNAADFARFLRDIRAEDLFWHEDDGPRWDTLMSNEVMQSYLELVLLAPVHKGYRDIVTTGTPINLRSSKDGVRISADPDIMQSGRRLTTDLNTTTNLALHLLCFADYFGLPIPGVRTARNPTRIDASARCVALGAGDDGDSGLSVRLDAIEQEIYAAPAVAAGFPMEVASSNCIDDTSFCSQHWIPMRVDGELLRTPQPKVGRVLSKLGYTAVPLANGRSGARFVHWLVKALSRDYVMPVVRACVEVMRKHSEWAKPQARFDPDFAHTTWMAPGIYTLEITDETWNWFCDRYHTTRAEVLALEAKIAAVAVLPAVIDDALYDRIIEIDTGVAPTAVDNDYERYGEIRSEAPHLSSLGTLWKTLVGSGWTWALTAPLVIASAGLSRVLHAMPAMRQAAVSSTYSLFRQFWPSLDGFVWELTNQLAASARALPAPIRFVSCALSTWISSEGFIVVPGDTREIYHANLTSLCEAVEHFGRVVVRDIDNIPVVSDTLNSSMLRSLAAPLSRNTFPILALWFDTVVVSPLVEEVVKRTHPIVRHLFIWGEFAMYVHAGHPAIPRLIVAGMHYLEAAMPLWAGITVHAVWNHIAMTGMALDVLSRAAA